MCSIVRPAMVLHLFGACPLAPPVHLVVRRTSAAFAGRVRCVRGGCRRAEGPGGKASRAKGVRRQGFCYSRVKGNSGGANMWILPLINL